ncbi:MAG TPA: multiheme c-type cytochrome, partial [Methylococcaceae bacterium]|nr:multiheme c-type cytochrome [Methylococcaceae bacterium]
MRESAAAKPAASPRPIAHYAKWLAAGLAAVLAIGGLAVLVDSRDAPNERPPAPRVTEAAPVPPPSAAHYTGSQVCAACHEKEYQAWRGSHHALAMQEASDQSVLGDFSGAKFSHAGVTSTFFRRDGKFYVNTDGPDGNLADFEVKYTFGLTPLQQYLIPFPDGRMQALGIAWDSRPKGQGGQRWFHLYPKDTPKPGEILHWTGRDQTWNYQCAECHSTDLRKNYDLAGNRYATAWAEISVGCEACHGPGSRHVEQARAGKPMDGNKGFPLSLTRAAGAWTVRDGQRGIAEWTGPARGHTEVEACARCHARRGVSADPYTYGKPLPDTHTPALLSDSLYYADGQIQGEVFEYASFLQSRMHRVGVTCSDCHEPHGIKLRAEGNAV